MIIHNKKKRLSALIINSIIEFLWLPKRLFSQKINLQNLSPKKILVLRLDHVGDVVMTSPSFAFLRKRFPKAKIILLADSTCKHLYQTDPNLSEILIFNWPWAHQKKNNKLTSLKIREIFNLIVKLRKERIDLFIDFRGDLRFVFLFGVLTGSKVRISNSRIGQSSLLHHIAEYKVSSHEVERTLDVVKCLGGEITQTRPQITMEDTEITEIKCFVQRETGVTDPGKIAVIAPYSSQDIKSWPGSYFLEVISYLDANGFLILILGTSDDLEDSMGMITPAYKNVFSLAGKTDIRQVAALIAVSTVVVGIDTGVLHIASCFDIPVIAIFGPTRPLEFKPYSPFTSVVDSGACECNQFLHLECDCPVDGYSRCLTKALPASVISALEKSQVKIN